MRSDGQALALATDGSDAAGRAFKHSLGLVNAVGPNVTVLTVKPPWPALAFGVVQGLPSREDYEAAAAEQAEKNLLITPMSPLSDHNPLV